MASIDLVRPRSTLSGGPGTGDAQSRFRGGGFSDAILWVSGSVFIVVAAYAAARRGLEFAPALFWVGQIGLFAFVGFRVLRTRTSHRDRAIAVAMYAAAQSMIRWAYSPHMFTYSDELQHFRSLTNVLDTERLFQTNYSLPVSPSYPGMENAAAELAQVSHIGPFLAGVLIASVAHVLLACCLVLLFREVTNSSRVSCVAALIYLVNPNAAYFDTSFHYESIALPFLVLALYFAIRFASFHGSRVASMGGFLLSEAAIAVTHHLTGLVSVALLACLCLMAILFRDSRRLSGPLALCTVVAIVTVGCWMTFFAPLTIGYLDRAGAQIVDGLTTLGGAGVTPGMPAPPTPLFDRTLTPAGVALTTVLLIACIGVSRHRPALERVFICFAPTCYAFVIAVRFLVSNGTELASRSFTYTALFTSLAVAVVFVELTTVELQRHRKPAGRSCGFLGAVAMAIVLFLAGVTTGIPSWWERLPGSFHVDGFASGIDNVGISRAEWAHTHLQPGARYFGDTTSVTLLASLARLDPIRAPRSIYYSDHLTDEDLAVIDAASATYLDVDLRMSDQVPQTGAYFPSDVMEGEHHAPIELAHLLKFDAVNGISRMYDSGYDRFYDLRGVRSADDGG